MTQTYSGGCQCGQVRYEVQMDIGEVLVSTCGIQSFAIGTQPKSGAKMAAINVRCVDGIDVDSLKVKKVDGRHL
jgi:hypothetical protein